MSISTPNVPRSEIIYPDSDGQPMADNTLQFQWIVTTKEGLERAFHDCPNVFVAGDLLWYPVQGNPKVRQAPDALVVLGRPKGYRGSYKQWEEGGIAPQVVFEVLSPGNRPGKMARKLEFYETYGVDEYYIYDPDDVKLTGHLRSRGKLEPIAQLDGWISPLLGIRFDLSGPELRIFGPDGERFLTYQELAEERDRAKAQADTERDRADTERDRADTERDRADTERDRADTERDRADTERDRADTERDRADRLAAQLRAMGIDPPE